MKNFTKDCLEGILQADSRGKEKIGDGVVLCQETGRGRLDISFIPVPPNTFLELDCPYYSWKHVVVVTNVKTGHSEMGARFTLHTRAELEEQIDGFSP